MTHTILSIAAAAPAAGTSPSVDIGIVTIRDNEFRAVLAAFPDKVGVVAPHVLPLFGPINPQVSAPVLGRRRGGRQDRRCRSGGARDSFSFVS